MEEKRNRWGALAVGGVELISSWVIDDGGVFFFWVVEARKLAELAIAQMVRCDADEVSVFFILVVANHSKHTSRRLGFCFLLINL